jgi:ATP-binding cassette subfamily F protein 3
VANGKTMTELRSLLGCFLFSEDDVFKQIGVLSGGERNRYALARMLLNPSNFLLLDEPTNHLDLRAKDVLLESLQEFTGTVVFVSHDRYFIDKLATKVFEIAGGNVEVFPGNYEDFQYRKGGGSPLVQAAPAAVSAAVESDKTEPAKPRRLNPMKVKQLEDRAAKLEARSVAIEAEIAELEQALQGFVSAEETKRQMDELGQRREELEQVLGEWEEVTLEMEESR